MGEYQRLGLSKKVLLVLLFARTARNSEAALVDVGPFRVCFWRSHRFGGVCCPVTRKAGVMAGQSDPLTAFALDKDF